MAQLAFGLVACVMRCCVVRFLAALAWVLLWWQRPAWAGAYLQDAGHGQLILSGNFTDSSDNFDASGKIVPLASYRQFDLTAHFEYGVSDWLTLIFAPSFAHESDADMPPSSYTGLGSTEMGGRVKLYATADQVLSFQSTLIVPGSFDRSNPILIGTQSVEADARFLYGRSFDLGSWASFIDAEAGYRLRGAGAPNEFHADFTFGTRPSPNWMLLEQPFSTISDGAGTLLPDMQTHVIQSSVVYEFEPQWSLQLGLFATVAAVNQRRDRGVVTALWRDF
jgi:hypothetical protein